MRIEEVKINEYKILKGLEFNPEGKNVLIIGENGLGKSTILQFIRIALGDQSNIPPDAFGDGVVVVNKKGIKYTLKVKITNGKSIVTIVGDDGLKSNLKSAIANLVGPIEFDVEQFIELSRSKAGRKQQVEIVKGFFPEEIKEDIRKHENTLKVEEQERTDIGRDRDKLHGSIESNPLKNTDLKSYPFVDISKVSDELKTANEHNAKIKDVIQRGQTRVFLISSQDAAIIEANAEINKKKNEIIVLEEKIAKANAIKLDEEGKNVLANEWIKANPLKDISDFETTIKNATETNAKHASAKKLLADMEELESLKNQYGEQTVKIELTRQAIADTIREIGLPVDGLSFDEEKLIYNGLPVHPDSQSESEIMHLGCKLKFCENPDLGILLLERTESIGQKRWEDILKMCKENNFQLIGELVKRGEEKLQIEIMAE